MGARTESDHSPRIVCPWQIAEQTPGPAERTALLRFVRGADGLFVFGDEDSPLSLLCLPERAAQGLGSVSREIAAGARNRGIGPGADAGSAARNPRSRRMGTDGPCQPGGGDADHRQ